MLKKFTALLMAAVVVLSLCGCVGKGKTAVTVLRDVEPVYSETVDASKHYCEALTLKPVASSGLIALLYDENSKGVVVKVTGKTDSKQWFSLPEADADAADSKANVVELEVIHKGGRYFLNSQDDSVAVDCSVMETVENGLKITYMITDAPSAVHNVGQGAADEVYSAAVRDNILYKVEVTYILKDGCLYADLAWKNLGSSADILANIAFLEHFGAVNQAAAQQGDFILVPDGCGATIDLASEVPTEPVNIKVYGDFNEPDALNAVVPAYGMKCGNDAFVAIIEQGDAVASINAEKAADSFGYSRVGAEFEINPSQTDGVQQHYSDINYGDKISICFRFLSGTDATYAGLAAACREQLVRDYVLSTGSVTETEYMPIIVNTIGKATKNGKLPIRKTLTDFSEAYDLLNRIKSKGINNVYLRYSGALAGGLDAENALNAGLGRGLGGKSALTQLNDYASGFNFNIFLDVSLVTSSSPIEAVGNLLSFVSKISDKNILEKSGFVKDNRSRYVTPLSKLEAAVLSVLECFNGLDATGFCVADAASALYNDYYGKINREKAASMIGESVQPLSTQNLVMVEKGNFYSLKNADVVVNIPMTCGRKQDDAYTAVPFVQIILHGIIEFSGEALNLSADEDLQVNFLRSIEFGALSSFALTNDNFDGSDKYDAIFNTDNWLNMMYSCYSRCHETLNDLRSSRITNHYEVSPGVYCTEYESTTRIYVNYTQEPVAVSGITVEPMNFFRVN